MVKRSSRTRDAAPQVFALMAEGRSLRKACEACGIKASTLLGMVADDAELARRYARARDLCLEHWADELVDLADTPREGVEITEKGGKVAERKRRDMLEHRRLQIETRKWLLARLKPQRYGDRVQVAGDAANPLSIQVVCGIDRSPSAPLPEAQGMALVESLPAPPAQLPKDTAKD